METEQKTNGALIGLVVIVVLLVVGGIYVWQSKVKKMELQKTQNTAITEEDTNALYTLEQDVNNLDTDVNVDVNSLK